MWKAVEKSEQKYFMEKKEGSEQKKETKIVFLILFVTENYCLFKYLSDHYDSNLVSLRDSAWKHWKLKEEKSIMKGFDVEEPWNVIEDPPCSKNRPNLPVEGTW